jgi:methionyl-tRNA synthetase
MDNAQKEPFDDFRRIELRIGTVVEVNDHPEAEKLYVLKVDLGEEEPRTIVTNIKSYYPYDKMMGRKLLVVSNLKSANFRGVKSFGMLMAAEDLEMGGNSLLLLDPSVDVPNGTLMSCGMETKGLRCEMKHLEKVTIKVAKVVDGKFMGMDIELPEGAPERVAAVIDGDKAVVLGDGKGCVMTVDGDIKDGAPAL